MPWLQLKIDSDRSHAEAIEDLMLATGAVSVTLQDNADQPILEPALGETPLWQETRVTGLYEADIDTKAISGFFAEQNITGRWEQLEDKDWEREWMKNYYPIQCADDFWICPSWIEPPQPEAINLMLDPGLAFGTGTHPTTFLCLQWLAAQDLEDQNIIDYGCGSGILAIGALLKGAKKAIGVDIDPQALIATRENSQRNQLPEDAITVFLPEKCPREAADVMLANILAGPLAELAPSLSALTKLGGKLCLSGILFNQAEVVMAAYQPWFAFDEPQQHEEWVCLTATKIKD
ncbi:50S ribosomal protein L11 methyltransferase [Pseudoteredinibacter isoporae]|uniref:Ribosomal protein L11 methyltransferase n=1 Tax=Pseudoteredinibacter isoporae TaxID=570281 RepID=A0A7X0JRJ9_9GAMM|nr:50S ribosomal protein L11 methyltransferase [Pseudoteredinibacter isoporae]MBB6520993.1 ribosomal protein L11 methyltransferase [Pseudoteredinibacter isoporae]NHO86558.1 50S ribosomal protein L11 methyltransferase [Pseudoteredinibacter isoporae]NIB24990.1 50S ribosomal protein L11 methyltransferase [Pseudoteredinibacter isoporae]